MVKMLTVLVSTISNSRVFLLKNVVAFAKATHIYFSKSMNVYAILNDQSFKDNDIVSFEQLSPGVKIKS